MEMGFSEADANRALSSTGNIFLPAKTGTILGTFGV